MKILNMVLSILLLISIPITTICISNNLTTRMPDIYQFEFKASQNMDSISIEKNEDQMGEFFSEFMFGKIDVFQIEYKVGENRDVLFTENEIESMNRFRKLENVVLIVAIVSFIVSLTCYILLYKQNLKKYLRETFIKALFFYTAISGILLALTFIKPVVQFYYNYIFNYEIKEFLVLPQLFSISLIFKMMLTTIAVSLVIMLILWYITWGITKPRRIFGSQR